MTDEIREAFEAWDAYEYVIDKFHENHVFSVQDVVYCMGIATTKSAERIEEVKCDSYNKGFYEGVESTKEQLSIMREALEDIRDKAFDLYECKRLATEALQKCNKK